MSTVGYEGSQARLAGVAALVALGVFTGCRGGISEKPPIHLVQDMDFQQKLKAQSESTFPGWEDGRGMRLPVAGTIARGGKPAESPVGEYYVPSTDEAFASFDANQDGKLDRGEVQNLPYSHRRTFALADTNGDGALDRAEATEIAKIYVYKNADGSVITNNPLPATQVTLERGRDRFEIHCAVCHGVSGRGGLVAERWPTVVPDLVANEDAENRKRLISLPPGDLFRIITEGQGTMPSYAHQIDVDDRWAIAHYLRALQNHFN